MSLEEGTQSISCTDILYMHHQLNTSFIQQTLHCRANAEAVLDLRSLQLFWGLPATLSHKGDLRLAKAGMQWQQSLKFTSGTEPSKRRPLVSLCWLSMPSVDAVRAI